MSRSRKSESGAKVTASTHAGRRLGRLAAVVLAVVVMAAIGLWLSNGRQDGAPPAIALKDTANAVNRPASSATLNSEFEKLTGRWERPDGGYILEIVSVEPDGTMNAAYFNPRAINVAKAEASQNGQAVGVFIELRDVNYPGSTYTLVYEPASDQLKGIYFQAAWQQQYEVFFERLK